MAFDTGRVLARLDEWAAAEGGLPDYLQVYRELLSLQARARGCVRIGTLPSADVVSKRLREGLPALQFNEMSVDWNLFASTAQEAIAVLEKKGVIGATDATYLRDVARNQDMLRDAARSLYDGSLSQLAREAEDGPPLEMVVEIALWPFVSSHAEALSGIIDKERWFGGRCPVCGGRPDIGFLERDVGARWLVCHRCDTQWPFKRLECPFCGTHDAGKLRYSVSEDGLYRLYLCELCGTYLKVVDLRKAPGEVLVPLERLMTLDMDRQALELGYAPYRTEDVPPGEGKAAPAEAS